MPRITPGVGSEADNNALAVGPELSAEILSLDFKGHHRPHHLLEVRFVYDITGEIRICVGIDFSLFENWPLKFHQLQTMRPDGPRDSIAGPDSGPEPPFPLKLSGDVVKGFGRGSKEVRTFIFSPLRSYVLVKLCPVRFEANAISAVIFFFLLVFNYSY